METPETGAEPRAGERSGSETGSRDKWNGPPPTASKADLELFLKKYLGRPKIRSDSADVYFIPEL